LIDKYLISNCIFIIDEFNDCYQNIHLKDDLNHEMINKVL